MPRWKYLVNFLRGEQIVIIFWLLFFHLFRFFKPGHITWKNIRQTRAIARKKLLDNFMSMKKLWLRLLASLPMSIGCLWWWLKKKKSYDWGDCLGLLVTSYSPADLCDLTPPPCVSIVITLYKILFITYVLFLVI